MVGGAAATSWASCRSSLYVGVFLVIPTLVVVIGAFAGSDGGVTLDNLAALADDYIVDAFVRSIALSAVTAVIGAVFGALLAYAVVTGRAGRRRCAGRSPRRAACWPSSAA